MGRINKKFIGWTLLFIFLLSVTIFGAMAKDSFDPFEGVKENKTIKEEPIKTEKDIKVKDYFVEVDFIDKINSSKTDKELKDKIKTSYGSVSIDDEDLKNKKAKLTFNFFCAKNPILLHNGKWEQNIELTRVGLCNFEATVNHFSTWQIIDNTFNGTHNRTTVYTEGLGLDIDALLLMSFDDVDKDSTVVEDYSYYSNNASIPLKWVTGKFENGLSFDESSNYIDLNKDYDLENFSFSIFSWVYLPTITGKSFDIIGVNNEMGFGVNSGTDNLRFALYNASGSVQTLTSYTAINRNVWQQVGVVYNHTNTTATFYINGTFAGTEKYNTINGYRHDKQDNWKVGHFWAYGNATVDELKVYQKALTQDEITNIYNNESNNFLQFQDSFSDSLNHHFKLDDVSGAVVDDRGNEDGTNYGATTLSDGKINYSYDFDGDNDYIAFGDTSTLANIHLDLDFTISIWAKNQDYSEDSASHAYLATGSSGSHHGFAFLYTGSNDRAQFQYYNGGGVQTSSTPTNSLANNNWNHIVAIGNGTDVDFYINGVYYDSGVTTSSLSVSPTSTYLPTIGGASPGGVALYNGNLDEVKVFNRTLTVDEVQQLYYEQYSKYEQKNKLLTDGLHHYYNFDETSGNLIDQKGSLDGVNTDVDQQYEGTKSYGYYYNETSSYTNFNDPIIDGWTATTFSIWVKADTMASDGSPTSRRLIGVNGGNAHHITFNEVTKETQVYFRNDSLTATTCLSGNGIVEDSSWHHIAVTLDTNGDGLVRLYKDSELVCTAPTEITGTFLDGGDLGISAPFRNYNGSVDEFRVYNKSLNQNEINALYHSGAEILNLDLDETNYDVAKDSSGTFNNGTLVSWIRPENTTGNWSQGLEFDGVDDYIFLGDVGLYANQSHTSSIWVKYNNISKKQIAFDVGYSASLKYGYLFIKWEGGAMSLLNPDISTTFSTNAVIDTWYNLVATHNGSHLSSYLNGVLKDTKYAPWGYQQDYILGAEDKYYGTLNGTLDEVKILNRSLNADEVLELYNNNPHSKYYGTGSYETEIYNVSDYTTGVETNLWTALVTDNITGIVEVWGRGGNCTTLSGDSYTIGTWNGTYYTFSGEQGECFQANLILEGDTENITYYDNVSITAVRVVLPFTDNETIYTPYNIFTNTSISGQAMFLVNDTDTGSLEFNWYVNNVNVYNQTFTALANGSTADSLISSSYYVKEDEVNFTVTPITQTIWGNATGQTVWSLNTITINNSNFTMSRVYPTLQNFSWQVDNNINFDISIVDVNNDVNCSWTATNPLSPTTTNGTGLTFNPILLDYNPSEVVTINATCSDGEYIQGVVWYMTITESLGISTDGLTLALVVGLGIIAFIFIYFAFNLDENHFLLKILFIFLTLGAIILIPATLINGYENTSKTLLKLTTWAFRLFVVYFFIYIFYHWTKRSEVFAKWIGRNR